MKKFEKKPMDYNQTKEKALRLLEFRSHSSQELVRKLKTAGGCDNDIEKVLEFLAEYNMINDESYAKRLALDLQNLKKYGKRRIRTELLAKGISQEYVEKAIEELPEPEEDVLTGLIRKRLKGDFEQKNKDRVMRYFLYRGYAFDEIKKAIWECEENDNYI